MKFYCDACNTKYAISDEKVRGKVLKVRCKSCGNIITVREAVAPITGRLTETDPTISSPAFVPPEQEAVVPTNNWYYALNGQTFGPFTLEGLRRKYASAEIGDATYVWHEKRGPWKPVSSEPVFADALAMGHKIVPSRKTLGFTGPVEAIRVVHGGPNKQRAGAVPDAQHAKAKPEGRPDPAVKRTEPKPLPQPKPKPKQESKPAESVLPKKPQAAAPPPERVRPVAPRPKAPVPTPEARPLKDARQSSLDKLRKSLDGEADESLEPLPSPVGGEAIFTFADGITPASAESSQELSAASDAFDFDLPPKHRPAKLSPSSRSDILDRVIGRPEEPPPSEVSEVVDDSGVIPFFPEAPQLSPQKPGALSTDVTSESLLIDVSSMNKKGRKRGAALGAIGVLLLGMAIVGGVVMASNSGGPAVVVDKPRQQDRQKDDLVFKKYGKGDVNKIATLNLDDELLFTEDEAQDDEAPNDNAAGTNAAGTKGADTASDPIAALGGAAKKKERQPKPALKEKKAKSKHKPAAEEKQPEAEAGAVPEKPAEPEDPIAQLLKQRAGRSPSINAPPDRLRSGKQATLTKDQARRGFQKVKKSIRDCRERHNRYNAKLDAGKLKISVTVEPTGSVSSFDIQPRSVQNTEFHKCMKSHKGRWRFAQFSGKAMVINTSVVIQ